MPFIISAAKEYATVGEIIEAMKMSLSGKKLLVLKKKILKIAT